MHILYLKNPVWFSKRASVLYHITAGCGRVPFLKDPQAYPKAREFSSRVGLSLKGVLHWDQASGD